MASHNSPGRLRALWPFSCERLSRGDAEIHLHRWWWFNVFYLHHRQAPWRWAERLTAEELRAIVPAESWLDAKRLLRLQQES